MSNKRGLEFRYEFIIRVNQGALSVTWTFEICAKS